MRDIAAELRAYRELALVAVREFGINLEYAPDELRAYREVVLAAVHNSGFALQFVAEELRGDREVVLAALCRHWRAWQFVPALRQADPVVLGCLEYLHGPLVLEDIGESERMREQYQ